MVTTHTMRARSLVLASVFLLVATVLVAIGASRADAAYPGGNGWIAFQSGNDIFAMPADGSAAPTNLTGPAGPVGADAVSDPAFSPDGTKLAFARSQAGVSAVWIGTFTPGATPTLSAVTQITTGGDEGADGEPTWSPDQSTVAFERFVEYATGLTGTATGADATGVVLTDSAATFVTDGVQPGMTVTNDTDGSTGTVLTVDTQTQLTLSAALSGGTDNQWASGDAYTTGHGQLRLFTAATSGGPTVGTALGAAGQSDAYANAAPVWSPANDLIAFETNRGGNTDIFTIPVGGGAEANLTDAGAFDNNASRPSWSPAGTEIAFHSAEPDTADLNIWTMVVATKVATQVTGEAIAGSTGTDDDLFPTFSPDGTKIAFRRAGAGGNTTWTVNTNGTGLQEIRPENPTHNEADWQPALLGVADAYNVTEGATLNVAAPGVLDNDVELSVGALTASKVTDPAHGTLTLNADGSFSYVHDGSNDPSDSFTYRPLQGAATGSVATVTITINPGPNVAPVAVNDGPYDVVRGSSVTILAPGVLGNDTDGDAGDTLTAVKVSDPGNGTVTLISTGAFTYTHNGSAGTSDSFTYRASDGTAQSNVATVSLNIVDPPPVLTAATVGLVDPAQGFWTLYDGAGSVLKSFFYGNPGDFPIMGDWNCDGVDTPGMYRQSDGFVYLRNSNTQGIGDIRFFFGNPGDVPIVGDFNADGCDTVGIYRPAEGRFYIINELGQNEGGLGAAEFNYLFGNPGDKPFIGDFDGDGIDTVGLHRESTGFVYFRNTHTQGIADSQFFFGDPGDRLVAGDWGVVDATDTPAVFRPSNATFYFRHTNTQGNADSTLTVGQPTWLPVAGVFE